MRTLALLIFVSLLAGCAKSEPHDYGVAGEMAPPVYAQLSAIPQECSFTASGAHQFMSWGSLQADEYACTSFASLSCKLNVGAEHTEMECLSSAPQSAQIPAGCSAIATGTHAYRDGNSSASIAYDCGTWKEALHCTYFYHSPDMADPQPREEVLCKQLILWNGITFWGAPKN
jgi:hypothetical protein